MFTVASDSCGVARLGGEVSIVLQLLSGAWTSPPTLPAPLISDSGKDSSFVLIGRGLCKQEKISGKIFEVTRFSVTEL